MPKLGADMDAGKLVAWRKKIGEAVSKGEIIADVETDKAEVEVESFQAGVLERILVQPGERVPVGTALAILKTAEGEAEALPPPPSLPPSPRTAPLPQPAQSAPAAQPSQPRVPVSPAAKRRALELGVDLTALKGTGPGGRIQLEDVEPRKAPAPAALEEDPRVRMRRAIATAMSRSKREIPHYYLSHTIDLAAASAWLAEANTTRPVQNRLLLGSLLFKAVALALREVPELNGFWIDETFRPSPRIHLGVAIALRGGGLMAPALMDADRATVDDLNARMTDLVARTRSGGLRGSELSDPTITVTSLGDRGVEAVFGVIHPPQVAMVGLGKIVERPWAVRDRVVVHPVVTATLSADHRVSDGHRGGVFLAALERLLQTPEGL